MADQITYKLYQYTDEVSHHWTVRCDADWGDNPDSGLNDFSPGDPKLQYFGKRYHPRYIILQDDATGRRTRRVCGTNDCTAWAGVNAGGTGGVGNNRYDLALPIPGTAAAVTYRRVKRYAENMPAEAQPRNFPESTA